MTRGIYPKIVYSPSYRYGRLRISLKLNYNKKVEIQNKNVNFMSMIIEYSKKISIAVIELSSSGVKSISACPMQVRKRDDLSKFSDDRKLIYNLFQLFKEDKTIDEKRFEAEVLPLIIRLYRHIRNARNPEVFKIIATGYYRMAENISDIIKMVEDAIVNQSRNKNFSIEVLSKYQESQLSFVSWYSTKKSLFKTEEFKRQYFKNNNIGINIDCGGSTIEISFLKNINDFSETLSLHTEITKKSNGLANRSKFSFKEFDKVTSKLVANALYELSEHYTRIYTISFCVITGSNISKFCNSVFEETNDIIETDHLHFPLIQFKSNLESSFNTYSVHEREDRFKQILSVIVIKAILGFLRINYFNLNKANLRVGCYYDMLSRLRENKNPYA
ncbi:hypothetical protein OS188_07390 [Xanthomarina sp. F1114]|uniref:Ppx/GppA phosphatase family protein n=1 Tax=Xanthomarina sp. F1114 TaxID=2996019 RepID=UPI00225E0D5A|nr:hypothetical protein [Xanthomarina sp. F1114]MCX7547771.1 hypothetical protein [Xanthomarina sp. F1114]